MFRRVLALALALLVHLARAQAAPQPEYAGSQACAPCHAPQHAAWRASHHAQAMMKATQATVRGDFANAGIAFKGATGRFFRAGPAYMAETDGADGKPADFAIAYTFGVAPLQQYLVAFPDGRLQPLPWAWDTRPRADGGQRWFHLYQDAPVPAADPLHWTRPMQNWNYMCAECHTTGLSKNYDAASNSYNTHFAETGVGCESCHGPGAAHIAWAHAGRPAATPRAGVATEAARRAPPHWSISPATGSPTHFVAHPPGDEVETCAHCHARRTQLAEAWQPGHPLLDTHLPPMLEPGLFEDDGQMKDEVFNDHAFKQSLMYARGVICTDCHDPHAGSLKQPGAAVCAQCHLPARFATQAHSFHRAGPRAPDCISCHMPARTYMVVDRRHDHSFRIPRPDLSLRFGTPNACTDCHTGKSAAWADAAITKWFGPRHKGHQDYTEAFHRARAGDAQAAPMLRALIANPSVPAVARATALTEVQRFLSGDTLAVTESSLADPDPLVRVAALRGMASSPPATSWHSAHALLADPVAAVRMQAALLLAGQNEAGLPQAVRASLRAAIAEYEAAQRLNADRPEAHANLAAILRRLGQPAEAEEEFRAGLRLDPDSVLLHTNLADLYRATSREPAAENALRDGIRRAPGDATLHHALGLSLIRQKNYAAALDELATATALAPDQPHFAYVYAVALRAVGRGDDAAKVVRRALARYPANQQLLSLQSHSGEAVPVTPP